MVNFEGKSVNNFVFTLVTLHKQKDPVRVKLPKKAIEYKHGWHYHIAI
jgi:hypothetical protein